VANLRIVLVEPQSAGNVGAAARVMKNFGFHELWIVGEHPPLEPLAGWWASGADDVLTRAHFAPTLHAAIAEAQMAVATTSARGRTTPLHFDPQQLAHAFGELGEEDILALVFGREDSGLTREEITLCQRTAGIPTDDAFPTMNLAQAVGIFCYQLSRIVLVPSQRERPTAALMERLHERVESLLLEAGFLHENNPDRIYDDIRSIVARADLDMREATILLGVIHQMEWKIRQ